MSFSKRSRGNGYGNGDRSRGNNGSGDISLLESHDMSFGAGTSRGGSRNASALLRSSNQDEDIYSLDGDNGGGTERGSVILGSGGGFVVSGRVRGDRHIRTVDLSGGTDPGTETVDLVDSDEEEEEVYQRGGSGGRGRGGGGGNHGGSREDGPGGLEGALGDNDVAVITIRPLSKSRLLPPPPPPEGDDEVYTEVVGEDRSGLNISERTGYIKEYVEGGLGMVFSMECGLVLFHLRNLCHDGVWVGEDYKRLLPQFPPGTNVTFLDSFHEGEAYRAVSSEGFIRQAAAMWTGDRPGHLLKALKSDEQLRQMAREREEFLRHVRGRKFMRTAMVRARGQVSNTTYSPLFAKILNHVVPISCQITGFLNDEIGLIETQDPVGPEDGAGDGDGNVSMVVFNSQDLFMFGRPWRECYSSSKWSIQEAFPPGLRICFDARAVERFRGVTAQAVAVFAGSWPATPHPTALPGGAGSSAPCHEDMSGYTFYYLNASLPAQLVRTLII